MAQSYILGSPHNCGLMPIQLGPQSQYCRPNLHCGTQFQTMIIGMPKGGGIRQKSGKSGSYEGKYGGDDDNIAVKCYNCEKKNGLFSKRLLSS